jgi:probable F420-dependent oxidoreductase
MELGVGGMNSHALVQPAVTEWLVPLVEQLGYSSWWAGDRIAVPSPRTPDAILDPDTPVLEPLMHLVHVAALTKSMRLGTGILILPLRNPMVLAKQVASLDVISNGRFLFGVGVGYLEPEMAAVGVPMAERGRRCDEYLDAMTQLWTSLAPAFDGDFVSFAGIDAYPRPCQQGGPPVIVGGRSRGAYRRAVSRGHGFYGTGTPGDIAGDLIGLRDAADEVERPSRLGALEITAMPIGPVKPADADEYARMGVDRLVVYADTFDDPYETARFLEGHADLAR